MRTWISAIALMMLAVAIGSAQTPEPTVAHLQAAANLIEVLKVETAIQAGVDLAMKQQTKTNPELAPYEGLMRDFIGKYVSLKNVGPQLTRLYADHFTEAELREMVVFYKSPTGQKAVSLVPELARKGGEIGLKAVQEHQQELYDLIAKRMQELDEQRQKQAPPASTPPEKPKP